MPLTFIDIERQKTWRIGIFFLLLMFIYLIAIALLTAPFLRVMPFAAQRFWVIAGLAALLVAATHFFISTYSTVDTIITSLDAQPPDPQDEVHAILINIMKEIHVVTGNRRVIRCVVIPSLSMNALAVADLKGDAVIGITEGLLSRLSRSQTESVIAHEAHHILSGDCLETTVAASLFGTFTSAIEKLDDPEQGRVMTSPVYLLAWLLLKLSSVLNMFISREREYRADAASVRMTRNPIALAETLYLLSRNWRGAGFIGGGYEMLCIVNPQISALDETEGFWADLLSTHPPLSRRIDILLGMAHMSHAELEVHKAVGTSVNNVSNTSQSYFALDPKQQWQGPFTVRELAGLSWFSPLTWITKGKEQPASRAWQEPVINVIFLARLAETGQSASDFNCPSCTQPLLLENYEGTDIYRCRFCNGTLVDTTKIPRIIARTEKDQSCSERINALAKSVVKENQLRRHSLYEAEGGSKPIPLLACPKCKNPMARSFYSMAHLITIDRCSFCGLTWFDRDELSMLQCLIVNRIVPDITHADTSSSVTR